MRLSMETIQYSMTSPIKRVPPHANEIPPQKSGPNHPYYTTSAGLNDMMVLNTHRSVYLRSIIEIQGIDLKCNISAF